MAWGTITIGGVVFREIEVMSENGPSVSISGQESNPPLSRSDVISLHANVLGLDGQTVPVLFSQKPERNGFYEITDARSTLVDWQPSSYTTASWQITMTMAGAGADVEFESRVPTIQRSSEITGQSTAYWHAPPVNTTSYFTGVNVPTWVDRASADGTVRAFLNIPVGLAPRWTVGVADYMLGSCDVTLDGRKAAGTVTYPNSTWQIDNGLVRVTKNGAGFSVAVWSNSAWQSSKDYVPQVGGASLTVTPEMTIIRNDPEEVVLRLNYAQTPGRVTLDIGLRRGSRFMTGFLTRYAAANLGVARTAAEAVTAATGGLRATSTDANGNRFVMGSTRVVTTATGTASMTDVSSTRFDFFLGAEIGATPQTGDAFAALFSQYLGTNGDRTRVMLR